LYKAEQQIPVDPEMYEEEIEDRKVLYECENGETASYIVAKIKT